MTTSRTAHTATGTTTREFDAWLDLLDTFLAEHDANRADFDAADIAEAFETGTGPITAAKAFADSLND